MQKCQQSPAQESERWVTSLKCSSAKDLHTKVVLGKRSRTQELEEHNYEIIGDTLLTTHVMDRLLKIAPSARREDISNVTASLLTNSALARFGQKANLAQITGRPFCGTKPLADHVEKLAGALALDGSFVKLKILTSLLIGEAGERVLSTLGKQESGNHYRYTSQERRSATVPVSEHLPEWLAGERLPISEHALALQVNKARRSARSIENIAALGDSSIRSALLLTGFQENFGHFPAHFHTLIHQHYLKGRFALGIEGERVPLPSVEMNHVFGMLCSNHGFELCYRLMRKNDLLIKSIRGLIPSNGGENKVENFNLINFHGLSFPASARKFA